MIAPLTTASLSECEQVIARGMETFVEVGQALMRIRDGRLYHKAFDTFEEYCQKRWGWNRNRAYKLMAAAETAECIQMDTKPANEAQARPLTKLPKEERAQAWETAVKSANNGKVTAKHVETVVREVQKTRREQKAEASMAAVSAKQNFASADEVRIVDELLSSLEDCCEPVKKFAQNRGLSGESRERIMDALGKLAECFG